MALSGLQCADVLTGCVRLWPMQGSCTSEGVPSSTTARAEPSVSTGAASVPPATQARRPATTRNASNATVSTSFGWGKGWNVTSAAWQVCDPTWHANSSSGVATSVSELLYPCYFTYFTLSHHCGSSRSQLNCA